MNEPITRSEMYLAALGGEAVTPPEPITRMDMYMAYLNGMTDTYPEPITRTEQYLYKLCQNGMGGGGGVTIRNQDKTITENGEYTADSGYTGLGKVTVNVEATGGGDDVVSAIADGTVEAITIKNGVSEVRQYAFYKCGRLKTVVFPDSLIKINNRAFEGCTTLENINVSCLQNIGEYAFNGCPFKASEFPELIEVGRNSFNAVNGGVLVFPKLEKVTIQLFGWNRNIEVVDLGCATSIEQHGFYDCPKLKVVVLRSNTVCALADSGAFNNTFKDTNVGTVYVPSALISEYQAATNWSTLYAAGTCNFVAIEGSEYE